MPISETWEVGIIFIGTKMFGYVWESRIPYQDRVQIYFENLWYPKTGFE